MSYTYYCMECHRPKFGNPRLWKGKTVCLDCQMKLEKRETKRRYVMWNPVSKKIIRENVCLATEEEINGENKALKNSGEIVCWIPEGTRG